jgi:hypothetical protein
MDLPPFVQLSGQTLRMVYPTPFYQGAIRLDQDSPAGQAILVPQPPKETPPGSEIGLSTFC